MNAAVERGASERHARAGAQRVAAIRQQHQDQARAFGARAATLERYTIWLSIIRFALFVLAAVWLTSFVRHREGERAWLAAFAGGAFVAAVVVHRRLLAGKRSTESAGSIHERHVQRTTRAWTEFVVPSQPVTEDHPYAWC